MSSRFRIARAAALLADGAVIAYPTEGVYGLGCLPDDAGAVERVLALKGRDRGKGLILIGADPGHLAPWIDRRVAPATLTGSARRPVTWVVPAAPGTPALLTGGRPTIAVRLTRHPVAAALCDAAGSALVSTSANRAGRPSARNVFVLRRELGRELDLIVAGPLGAAAGPSEIRDWESGEVLRPGGGPSGA